MPENDVVQDFAADVAHDAADRQGIPLSEDKQFSILVILAIIQTIIAIYRLCKSIQPATVQNPNIIQRFILRRTLRHVMKQHPGVDETFESIYEALLAQGKGLTEEKLTLLKQSLAVKIAKIDQQPE